MTMLKLPPDVQELQVEMARKMTQRQRAAMMCALTDQYLAGIRRAIIRLYPDEPLIELKLKYIQAQYGKNLADEIREWLFAQDKDSPRRISWEQTDPGFAEARREVAASD